MVWFLFPTKVDGKITSEMIDFEKNTVSSSLWKKVILSEKLENKLYEYVMKEYFLNCDCFGYNYSIPEMKGGFFYANLFDDFKSECEQTDEYEEANRNIYKPVNQLDKASQDFDQQEYDRVVKEGKESEPSMTEEEVIEDEINEREGTANEEMEYFLQDMFNECWNIGTDFRESPEYIKLKKLLTDLDWYSFIGTDENKMLLNLADNDDDNDDDDDESDEESHFVMVELDSFPETIDFIFDYYELNIEELDDGLGGE